MIGSSPRVLVVSQYYKPAYVYGGPVRSLSALAEGLARQKVNVAVFTTDANGAARLKVPLHQPVNVNGVEVTYYPLAVRSWGSFYYSPELAQACRIKVREYDLVLIEALWGHISGPVTTACKRYQVPYIVTPRGQLLPWSYEKKHLKKRLYMSLFARRHINGAAAIRCTDAVEAKALEAFNFCAPTFVVPNSVDTALFSALPPRQCLRKRLGIPAAATVLLFLGRLHQKKRPDIAVAALTATQELPGDVHLILVGPDQMGMGATLMEQAQRAGCHQQLHLVDLLEGTDVLQAFAAADLLLMPSEPHSENFGMSAVEAMAAGLPVLVSDGVPVGRLAQEAGAGCVTACTNKDFSAKTCELLADTANLRLMGNQGKKLVAELFDNTSVAQQMLSQIQAIIQTGRPLDNGTYMYSHG